jgi:pyridoxal phosphate enzyme (YggS family)
VNAPGALQRNLAVVLGRIAEACGRAGRSPGEVTLVVVTKTADAEVIEALAALGVRDVGENRVQALVERAERLKALGLRWHMIGHLQRNKVRKVLPVAHLIHSLDAAALAEAANRVAAEQGRVVDVLIEVNVSGEAQKFGLAPAAAEEIVRAAGQWSNLRVLGLMTMAPLVDDPETVRPVFAGLRELADRLRADAPPNVDLRHLSMGMTQDYVQAVEEGATIVRIGTAVVGGVLS